MSLSFADEAFGKLAEAVDHREHRPSLSFEDLEPEVLPTVRFVLGSRRELFDVDAALMRRTAGYRVILVTPTRFRYRYMTTVRASFFPDRSRHETRHVTLMGPNRRHQSTLGFLAAKRTLTTLSALALAAATERKP